jgi:hypothetical protein
MTTTLGFMRAAAGETLELLPAAAADDDDDASPAAATATTTTASAATFSAIRDYTTKHHQQ